MEVFRLTKKKYANDLSGFGAARYGNRWNSKGVEMVYTAESRALAMAEVMVHLPLSSLPSGYVMVQIEVPDELPEERISVNQLPFNWNCHPPIPQTQSIGDHFIHLNQFAILKVPSTIVPGDFNILINTNHPSFKHIKIKDISDFPFDARLFRG